MQGTIALLPILLANLAFSGTEYVSVNYQNEKFAIEDIRKSKTAWTVAAKIQVNEFIQTFQKRFGGNDSCWSYVKSSLKVSIAKELPGLKLSEGPAAFPSTAGIDDFNVEATGQINNPAITKALDSIFQSGNPKFFLYIHDITIDNINGADSHGNRAGLKIGSGSISGGNTEKCIVAMEVEIWDVQKHLRRMTLTSYGEGSMLLSSFKGTLDNALNGSIGHLVEYLKSGQTEF
jgi:hypothetical protein